MEMILFAAIAIVLANLALGVILWLRVRKLYSYPGLLGFPVIGNLFYFYKVRFFFTFDSIRIYLAQIAKRYGKNGICFHYGFGMSTLVIITSPRIIKQIGFHRNLQDKPSYVFDTFTEYVNGPFARARSDDIWKMKRKEYNSVLKKSRIEKDFSEIFIKSADKLIELMLASPSGLDAKTTLLGITQNVTMEILFGFEASLASHPQIIQHMHMLVKWVPLVIANPIITKIILILFKPFDEIVLGKLGDFRRMVLKEIHKKMNDNQSLSPEDNNLHDLLPLLIASRIEKNNKFDWNVLTELLDAVIAASNSIASTMSTLMTCLAVLPELQERAWKEQYELFGKDNRKPTLQDLQQMTYLERLIKECLRFAGPPLIAKQASNDIEVDGIIIPKDAMVLYLTDFMNKDPTYWKDPEVFDPDRFIDGTDESKCLFNPFGIGIRNCPGMYSAMLQLKILLSEVLRRTKLSPVKTDLKFENLKFVAKLFMELKNPPLLRVEERI